MTTFEECVLLIMAGELIINAGHLILDFLKYKKQQ